MALELEVLAKKFDRFGWDRDRGSLAQDRLLIDWMDALQDYPLDEVRAACRAAVIADPKNMPNEGHIVAKIMEARRGRVAAFKATAIPKPQDPPRETLSPGERAAIAADMGLPTFAPKNGSGFHRTASTMKRKDG